MYNGEDVDSVRHPLLSYQHSPLLQIYNMEDFVDVFDTPATQQDHDGTSVRIERFDGTSIDIDSQYLVCIESQKLNHISIGMSSGYMSKEFVRSITNKKSKNTITVTMPNVIFLYEGLYLLWI